VMRRRDFITLLGGAAAWPLAARAQQRAMPAVGVLRVNPRDSELFAGRFRRYMQAAGWVEGHNVRYDFVWADMGIERMPAADSDRRHGRRHPLPRLSQSPTPSHSRQLASREGVRLNRIH